PHILLDLRGLEGEAFREDERHAAPHGVRLNPFEVPVAADLLLLRSLPVDADRAVLDDQPDLALRREILQVHGGVVLAYLLDVTLHLLLPRDVAVHPERPTDKVAHEHRECLGGPPGTPDRPCIIDLQVPAAVVVSADA